MQLTDIRRRHRERSAALDTDRDGVLYDRSALRKADDDVAALLDLVDELLERTSQIEEHYTHEH
jgi:hypothetical protein